MLFDDAAWLLSLQNWLIGNVSQASKGPVIVVVITGGQVDLTLPAGSAQARSADAHACLNNLIVVSLVWMLFW
jgi:hypothetical protein